MTTSGLAMTTSGLATTKWVTLSRHSREGGNPALPSQWIPACAGMTDCLGPRTAKHQRDQGGQGLGRNWWGHLEFFLAPRVHFDQ